MPHNCNPSFRWLCDESARMHPRSTLLRPRDAGCSPSDYTEPDANGGDVKPLAKAGAGVPIAPFVSVTALALLVLIAVLVRRRAIGFERRPDSNASVRLRS